MDERPQEQQPDEQRQVGLGGPPDSGAPQPPRPVVPPGLPRAPAPAIPPPAAETGDHWHPGIQPPPATVPGQVEVDGGTYVPAGLWRRVGAFLIDAVVLYIAQQVALAVIGFSGPSEEQVMELLGRLVNEVLSSGTVSDSTLSAYYALAQPVRFAGWLNICICMAYFTVFHGMLGATLGKLCLGLRVLHRDGRALSYGWAWLRYLGYFIVAKLIYTAWLIPVTAERRTLYDIALGTNVFRQLTPAPARADEQRPA